MSLEFSILLDLIRAMAAFFVALAHLSHVAYIGEFKGFFVWAGNPAVMVFFVLSGYLIAFSCDTKHTNFKSYFFARLVRLLPVYLLALFLVPILDILGHQNNPDLYINYPYPDLGNIISRISVYLLFLQESNLFDSFRYFSNGPLWSLGYEFFYYIFFGIVIYFKEKLLITFLCVVLSFLFFPKPLLLFPVWLLGVAIYKIHKSNKIEISTKQSLSGFVLSLFLLLLVILPSKTSQIIQVFCLKMQSFYIDNTSPSSIYIECYLIGCIFALSLLCAQQFLKHIDFKIIPNKLKQNSIIKLIKTFSGFSYTLYVIHVPLIIYLSSFSFITRQSIFQQLAILLITYSISYMLSLLFERPHKILLNQVYNRLNIVR
jgi:peptidoglycan/LPS O-acetylase OafA/YrhL